MTAPIEQQRAQNRLAAQGIMDKIINNQTAPQDQWQAFTDSEKMVLRESYAQQYIKEALPKLIESRQSPVLKRLVNTPDNAAKAAILGSMNKK